MAQIKKTQIGTLILPNYIYNASGPKCTSYQELHTLDQSKYTGAVLSKSCTLDQRSGNEYPRYYYDAHDNISLNSTGLANYGYKYYGDFHSNNFDNSNDKPYIISVSGLCKKDNITIIKHLKNLSNVHSIEFNLSCPNIIGKSQLGYNLSDTDKILRSIAEFYEGELTNNYPVFGIKMPPYFDSFHISSMCDILKKYKFIKYITCINSLGNCLIIQDDCATIKPKNGLGGLGGNFTKPIGLSNVNQFYRELNKSIVGCGGINSGKDAYEYILAGASAVQIGTYFMQNDINIFEQITKECNNILNEKEHNELPIGRLKYL